MLSWTMEQHAELALVAARWLQTHVVVSIGPVDADESGILGVGGRIHGCISEVLGMEIRAMRVWTGGEGSIASRRGQALSIR